MKRKIILLGLILVMGINFFGCTQNSEQTEKKNEVPSALLEAELTGERLINDLETIYTLKQENQNNNTIYS